MEPRPIPADFIKQPGADPGLSLAADRHFMNAVQRASRTRQAVLRIYDLAGEFICLGRYHLAPEPAGNAGTMLWRRHSGGRAVPFGEGFVGVSLVLPHRSALFSEDPMALAPYQVINRYVRGILEACKLVGVPAFYPGRDFVTVNRRILALVSFETSETGALLFEAIIANTRDFSLLPERMETADPGGVVKMEMLAADSTTCLERELRTSLSFDEVAELLRRGFAKQFGFDLEPHSLAPLETQAIEAVHARELAASDWLFGRRVRPDLDRRASMWGQLGAFEVHFALEQERFLKDIIFAGDFLANSPGIDRLERALRLCPAEWRAVDEIASAVYADPENFILGIGRLRTIADLVTRGLAVR